MGKEHSPIRFIKNAAGATLLTVILVGCKGEVPAPTPSPETSPFSTPVPTETATPTIEPTPTLIPTPEPTPTPKPTADPKINCDQRLVPDAEAISPITKEPSKSFNLNVPILEYHLIDTFKPGTNIASTDGAPALSHLVVSPATFDAQMKILHDNGWQTITMSKLASDLEYEITPPEKTFVVTFDDGYRDGYENAWPILQKYGFVGTYFDITSRSDGSFLNPDQLRALSDGGNEIASHTVDHVSITSGKADYEVDASAEYIAKVTGKWPSTFAYPFGSFNTYAENAVARCQPMRMAVTTVQSVGETWANRFATPRRQVFPGTSPKYLLEMLTQYAKEPRPATTPEPQTPVKGVAVVSLKEDEQIAV
jgi:peptidoglycan/xylan/chitin deacetylase (PgdA/CDA1 family)